MKRNKGSVALIVLGVIAGAILLIGMTFAGSYNGFVSGKNTVETAWAEVETQYQRRFDLIPNLEGAAKGIFEQEREVFGAIAEARTRYAGVKERESKGENVSTDEEVAATQQYESALARLLVVIENYPQLKSNEQVKQLMDELAGTENRIAIARRRYNEEARVFNTSVQSFPNNIMAGMFNFKSFPYFESAEGANQAPKVDLRMGK